MAKPGQKRHLATCDDQPPTLAQSTVASMPMLYCVNILDYAPPHLAFSFFPLATYVHCNRARHWGIAILPAYRLYV